MADPAAAQILLHRFVRKLANDGFEPEQIRDILSDPYFSQEIKRKVASAGGILEALSDMIKSGTLATVLAGGASGVGLAVAAHKAKNFGSSSPRDQFEDYMHARRLHEIDDAIDQVETEINAQKRQAAKPRPFDRLG